MALFAPSAPYDAADSLGSTLRILIEYLAWALPQLGDTEGAVVTEGYPNFAGELPLAHPHVTVYPTAGGGTRSPGYDDLLDADLVAGATHYWEHGRLRTYAFNVDVWTSGGDAVPAGSGGIPVRNRLYGKILDLLDTQSYPLCEPIEVRETILGTLQEPRTDTDRDLCLARLTVMLEVPVAFRVAKA